MFGPADDGVERVAGDAIADLAGGAIEQVGGDDLEVVVGRVGEGAVAESIHQLFRMACNRFLAGREMPPYDYTLFVPKGGKQTTMFDR